MTTVIDATSEVVRRDAWDRRRFDHTRTEIPELERVVTTLEDGNPTGADLLGDLESSFYKGAPTLNPTERVKPSHAGNRAIMDEVMQTDAFRDLRRHSVGDPLNSALACVAFEPRIPDLYKRMENVRKEAETLAERQQFLDDFLNSQDEDFDPSGSEEFAELQGEVEDAAAGLAAAVDAAKPSIGRIVRQTMEQVAEQAERTASQAAGWGLDPGTISRTDPKERLALATRMNGSRLREIAEIVGRMVNVAWAARKSPTNALPEEIYDVTLGADLTYVLPSEFVGLVHDALRMDFLRRMAERQLRQYSLRGNEMLGKGPIVYVPDHSGSMTMNGADLWAAAFGLALMRVAKEQKRAFYSVPFGGEGVFKRFDFPNPEDFTPLAMMAYAEFFINDGGTHFETGLDQAVQIMEEEFAATGKVDSDIIFGTDGLAQVAPTWLTQFKATQARLDFSVYGFYIGGEPDVESISSICDRKVFKINDLKTGRELKDIFAGLW